MKDIQQPEWYGCLNGLSEVYPCPYGDGELTCEEIGDFCYCKHNVEEDIIC